MNWGGLNPPDPLFFKEIEMSADFGQMTIKNADGTANNSKGNAKAVADMIGTTAALRAASGEMQNTHIGLRQTSTVAAGSVPAANYYALTTTPGLKNDGTQIAWTITAGAGAWA